MGRLLCLKGYRRDQRGAKGRAFGMPLTMLPTLAGYLLAIALIVTPYKYMDRIIGLRI